MITMAKKHRTLSEWRELVEAWQNSGQTITSFCAENGLAESCFYARRKTLAEQDAGFVSSRFEEVKVTRRQVRCEDPRQLSLHFGSAKLDLPPEVEFRWVAGLMRALADATVS